MLVNTQFSGFGAGRGNGFCDSADFDGTNDYMLRGGALTGVVDGKKGIFSCWVRIDGGDGNSGRLFTSALAASERIVVARTAGNLFQVAAANSAGAQILNIFTVGTYTAGATWRHVLSSWDLGTVGARHIYITDVSDISVTTFTDDTIDYAMASPDYAVGARIDGNATTIFNGCMAELYFNAVDYLDLSVEANRRKFISSSLKPVDLGADGSTPTGTAPAVYLHLANGEAAANFATNRGAGGNFTITGTLDTGSTSPGD